MLEIDGASNNGVDDVRELRQNVQFRPSRSRYKIYIIDEVHMLVGRRRSTRCSRRWRSRRRTSSSSSRRPRCRRSPSPSCRAASASTSAASACRASSSGFSEIVAAEGMQADDEALEMVARRAGGSMRDAQSLLDQLLAFSGERLTAETVHQLLGTAHEERVAALAGAVLAEGRQAGAGVLDGPRRSGPAARRIARPADRILARPDGGQLRRRSRGRASERLPAAAISLRSKQQAEAAKLDTILAGMDVLVAAKGRMRISSHGRVVLEMALVRLVPAGRFAAGRAARARWLARRQRRRQSLSHKLQPGPRQVQRKPSQVRRRKKKASSGTVIPPAAPRFLSMRITCRQSGSK